MIGSVAMRFSGWWATLSARERVLVGTLGVLLALTLFVYGVARPLQAARTRALTDIRTYETLKARVRAAAVLGPSGPPPRTGSADAVLSASAQSAGVTVTVQPMTGGATASVAAASYDALLAWLADVARATSLEVTRLEVQRTAVPGQVTATIEVRE